MTPTAKDLLAKASTTTGLDDFGDDWFRGALEAYLVGLEGDHISKWGLAFLTRLIERDLARRLQIVDCLKQNPEIEETPVPPIVYVTGHERSGTTLLHNLLSLHKQARYLSRWELMMPTPPPQQATFATDPRAAAVQASVDALRGSDLEQLHWVNADEPEECVWGLMDCTGMLGMAPALILPPWMNWMESNDFTPSLHNYRKIIQILTWKNPVPEGGFLALKAPQMGSYLPNFLEIFPDTKFVYIHRDPYRVLRSFCTLIDVVDGPFLKDRAYLADCENNDQRNLQRMGQRFENLGNFESTHPGKVINVQYSDLLENPEAEMSRLYSQTSHTQDPELNARIEEFLRQQKAGHRASPRSKMIDYGYSREQVENYPPITRYLQRYKVKTEEKRQTGA